MTIWYHHNTTNSIYTTSIKKITTNLVLREVRKVMTDDWYTPLYKKWKKLIFQQLGLEH